MSVARAGGTLALTCLAGCHFYTYRPDSTRQVEQGGVRVQLEAVAFGRGSSPEAPENVDLRVSAPAGTVLSGALEAKTSGAPCGAGLPAVQMSVDGRPPPGGPLPVDGEHT
ncbi:MAG TPA: hypothetical protein VH208_09285, partial [Myxococcaceae bacterium]|nr:hypothetical protein [Myxococcaceae bacterium]